MKTLVLFLSILWSVSNIYTQNFYGTYDNKIYKLDDSDIITCRHELFVELQTEDPSVTGDIIVDVAFHPSGDLYVLDTDQLFKVDTITGNIDTLVQIPDIKTTGLIADSDGLLYITGYGFHIFNPSTNQLTTVGDLPEISGGDIVFHEDKMYYTTENNSLFQINRQFPEESQKLFDFPDDIDPISDIVNIVYNCDSSKYYLIPAFGPSFRRIYEYDFVTNESEVICNNSAGRFFQGGTSELDYLQSTCDFLIDLDVDNSSKITAQDYQIDTFCVTQLPIADNDIEIHADAPIDSIHIIIADSPQSPEQEELTIGNFSGLDLFSTNKNSLKLIATPTSTFEDYENAVRSIRYTVTGEVINNGERQIYVTAYSGGRESELATAFLMINTITPPSAGIDTDTSFCPIGLQIPLLSLLKGEETENGIWSPMTTQPDLFVPLTDSIFNFNYVTGGQFGCATDTAVLNIELLPYPQTGFPFGDFQLIEYCSEEDFQSITTEFDTSFVESFEWRDDYPDLNRTIDFATFSSNSFLYIDFTAPNGCFDRITFFKEKNQDLSIESQRINNRCHNGNEGELLLNITGSRPFIVEWSDGEMGAFRGALEEGVYEATVTDANGCNQFFRDTITAPEPFEVEGLITNATNGTTNDGAITITSVTGGIPPYELSWNNGEVGSSLNNLLIGDYVLMVIDSVGCSYRTGFVVSVNVAVKETLNSNDYIHLHPNPAREQLQIKFIKPLIEFTTLKLFNVMGQKVQEKILNNEKTQYVNLVNLASGVYLVQLQSERGTIVSRFIKQ